MTKTLEILPIETTKNKTPSFQYMKKLIRVKKDFITLLDLIHQNEGYTKKVGLFNSYIKALDIIHQQRPLFKP